VRAVSAAWRRTVASTHRPVFQAILCDTFQTGLSPSGTPLQVVDGSVTLDGLADVYTTANLTVLGDWPTRVAPELAPYGAEVFLRRGIQYRDDLIEWVGFGYLRLERTGQRDRLRGGPLALSLVDRMQGIIDARMIYPLMFPSGTTYGTFVAALVQEVYPSATITWDDDSDLLTLPRNVLVEEDRYAALKSAADSLGKIMHWNAAGALAFRSIPDPSSRVFTLHTGSGGQLVTATGDLSREGAYNGVVARGDGLDQIRPAYGFAYDANPASPTYWFGGYGKVPRYYASPFLASDAQALDAARGILVRTCGIPYAASFGALADPSLEPWDRGWVDPGRGAPETHTIASLTIPFTPDGIMEATMLEQTFLTIGEVSTTS